MDMLLQIQLMVDSGLLVLIWLVQLIIYPSFHHLDKNDFKLWHAKYTGVISPIVGPLMLLQGGIEILHVFLQDPRWWRLIAITALLLSTFGLSVPCHRTLQSAGKNTTVIQRLVATNWIRTALWTFLFLQSFWQGIGLLPS